MVEGVEEGEECGGEGVGEGYLCGGEGEVV